MAETTPYLWMAYLALAFLIVTVILIVLTYRSNFNRDRKIIMYVLLVLGFTPIALILFVIFKLQKK